MREYTIYSSDRQIVIPLSRGGVYSTNPEGFGNNFSVTYREGDRRRVVTKKAPSFGSVKLKILFGADGRNPREVYRDFMSLFSKLGREFLLEESSDTGKKACFATLVDAPKTEIQQSGIIAEAFRFDRLSYWFQEEQAAFTFDETNHENEGFPLEFPFAFSGLTLNREIEVQNDFFEPIPATIQVSGKAWNGKTGLNIVLVEKETEEGISTIRLRNAIESGETFVSDPETGKVTIEKDGIVRDAYQITDKTKDTFLYVPNGKFYLRSDMSFAEGGKLGITFRKYRFD